MCEVAITQILRTLKQKNQDDSDWVLRLSPNVKRKRSATLCVARAVPVSHGKITITLSTSCRVTDVENKSEISLSPAQIISHHISDIIAKSDSTVLDTLLEAHQECSAQLTLHLAGVTVGAMVRSVHHDTGIFLHCDVNKIENTLPNADMYSHGVSIMSNNDKLTELCSSVFNEEVAHPTATSTFSSSPCVPLLHPPIEAEKTKKPRKPRQKKAKAQPEKDACLKKLLSSRPPDHLPETAAGDYSYMEMYSASTMSAQPIYINNPIPPMGYQPSHSSYMQVHPGGEYGMPQPNPMVVPWGGGHPDYYGHPQQQVRVPYVNQTQSKGVKRKPTNQAERPNKMPYAQAPQFAFSQAAPGPLDPTGMPTMSQDEYHLQPMANNLSPFRYSPGSSPYWPAGGRPPSRSEMIRMELRNSLQAKQMANQQRQPQVEVPAPVSNESNQSLNSGIGADSLGFDLDIVLKDADGSLMDAELDTVYDFKLGGGCGFDMDNESTKCLVMKLLS